MSNFCEQCGSPLGTGVRFCEQCGHPVNTILEQTKSARPPSHSSSSPELIRPAPLSRMIKMLVGGGIAVGLIVFIAVGLVWWRGQMPSKKSAMVGQEEVPPQKSAPSPNAASVDNSGKYAGKFGGYLIIEELDGNNIKYQLVGYSVKTGTTEPNTNVNGIAPLRNNVAYIKKQVEGRICSIKIIFRPAKAIVKTDNCLYFTGTGYTFEGTYYKVKKPSQAFAFDASQEARQLADWLLRDPQSRNFSDFKNKLNECDRKAKAVKTLPESERMKLYIWINTATSCADVKYQLLRDEEWGHLSNYGGEIIERLIESGLGQAHARLNKASYAIVRQVMIEKGYPPRF